MLSSSVAPSARIAMLLSQTAQTPQVEVPNTDAPQAPAPQTEIAVTPLPSVGGPYSAAEMYEAAQTQRRLIRDQLSSAENERENIAQQLRQPNVAGADKEGLEAQLKAVDARILNLRDQLVASQTREAQIAALPGSTEQTPRQIAEDRFEIAAAITFILTLFLGLPLVLAWARRLWKKSAVTLSLTPELDKRLDAIERAVDATAIEIERVGEGQRFVTQLLASRAAEQAQQAQLPRET